MKILLVLLIASSFVHGRLLDEQEIDEVNRETAREDDVQGNKNILYIFFIGLIIIRKEFCNLFILPHLIHYIITISWIIDFAQDVFEAFGMELI
jgi:hypothetical protein